MVSPLVLTPGWSAGESSRRLVELLSLLVFVQGIQKAGWVNTEQRWLAAKDVGRQAFRGPDLPAGKHYRQAEGHQGQTGRVRGHGACICWTSRGFKSSYYWATVILMARCFAVGSRPYALCLEERESLFRGQEEDEDRQCAMTFLVYQARQAAGQAVVHHSKQHIST